MPGDLDITGRRRPQSYYREIVWGLRRDPYIAVQRANHYGEKPETNIWSWWSDSISSWTWPGYEGKPVVVEVYSDAEEVELLLNGRSIGRAGAGERNRFRALFDTVYEPGEIVAVAYAGGKQTGRHAVQSAGKDVGLQVESDRRELAADGSDLAFVFISFADKYGIVDPSVTNKVSIEVEGAGTLQGFGSADPRSTENFFDTEKTPFDGELLAVVRATSEAGDVRVRVSSKGFEEQALTLRVGKRLAHRV